MNLKYKLLVSDMDGTILNSYNEVGELTRLAVLDYINAGGHFAFCSGREVESLVWQAREMRLPCDKITFMGLNGCVISQNGKILRYSDLPQAEALNITEYLNKIGVYYQIYDQNGLYVKEENDISRRYCKMTHVTSTAVGDLNAYIARNNLSVVKILITAEESEIDAMSGALDEKFKSVQWLRSTPFFYEAAAKEGGKGNALRFLAARYEIDIKETAAIGDSQNDLSMIQDAGVGVAVANAIDEIKAAADVTLDYSNDDDPVGRFIRSYMK